jgi:hypothetical protein
MSVEVIAFAGVVSTAIVALAGFFVQIRIASKARTADRQRARYDELLEIYLRVGERMTALNEFLESGKPADFISNEDLHLVSSLYLHRCAYEVWHTYLSWSDAFRDLSRRRLDGEAAPNDAPELLSGRSRNFYIACAHHIERVWPARDGLDLLAELMKSSDGAATRGEPSGQPAPVDEERL